MGRPERIHLPGLIYHILNRGNNRQVVFVADEDYQHYLKIVKRYKEQYDFQVFAYCLMSNHIHLIIKTSAKGNISQIMQAITISHTRYYHHTYQSSGHIWQGRFKSPLISSDGYLLTAMQYVEQNPVRAGISKKPGDYSWSSFMCNAKGVDDGLTDRQKNQVYISMGKTLEEQQEEYSGYAKSLLEDEKIKEIRRSLKGQSNYMSARIEQEIKEKLNLRRKPSRGRPKKRRQKISITN